MMRDAHNVVHEGVGEPDLSRLREGKPRDAERVQPERYTWPNIHETWESILVARTRFL